MGAIDAEQRYQHEPRDSRDPEAEFNRRWAATLVTTALERLKSEMALDGEQLRFNALKGFLQGSGASTSYAEAAHGLGIKEGPVKSGIFRMWRRYAEIIRDEISETVNNAQDVEDEIRHLIAILAT